MAVRVDGGAGKYAEMVRMNKWGKRRKRRQAINPHADTDVPAAAAAVSVVVEMALLTRSAALKRNAFVATPSSISMSSTGAVSNTMPPVVFVRCRFSAVLRCG